MNSLDKKWDELVKKIEGNFDSGINIKGILYLIGIQELNLGVQQVPRDEKLNVLHIAVCKILAPYGYYVFDRVDKEGWPHYTPLKPFESLSESDQEVLIKKGIIKYLNES